MENSKKLDFIVIGAAKSGTTTLQEILSRHPDIYLPKYKEVPFFTEDKLYSKGLGYFINKVYKDQDKFNLLGKITPQYMDGSAANNPKIIANRIKETLPNAKIIAILRDPLERCYSYYNMSVRLGYEKRTFEMAINDLLKIDELAKSRDYQDWTNSYVVGGEYGRILSYYYDNFDNDHILVLFTQDLKNKPKETIMKILNFIEADSDNIPDNYAKIYHAGGNSPKIKYLSPGYLYKIPYLKYFWNNIVPFTYRRKINQNINHWNISTNSNDNPYPQILKDKLIEYYESDKQLLTRLTELQPPWR